MDLSVNRVPSQFKMGKKGDVSSPIKKEVGVWAGFAVKALASVAVVSTITHILYQNFYSPSRSTNDPSQSLFNSIYSKHVTSCDDTSFKVLQNFFRIFETQSSVSNLFGLAMNEPFGDLKAFILDQNFEGLECAYSSYSDDQVNLQMKNKLLSYVMKRMENHYEGFEKYVEWLVKIGADPNLVVGKTTPLMLAYRMLDANLFDFLISKGANPDLRILSESLGGSYQMQPTLKIITDELGGGPLTSLPEGVLKAKTTKRRVNNQHCNLYKRIIDSAIEAHVMQLHSFPNLEKDELTKEIYRTISKNTCPRVFKVAKKHVDDQDPVKSNFFEDVISWTSDKLKEARRHYEAFRRAQEEFFKAIPKEDRDDAYKILGLDKEELSSMSPSDFKKAMSKACREKLRINHPDKGGKKELYYKVSEACDDLKKKNARGK
ncbi:MAG: hypothetical protein S4CHLAM6_05890 [Chlamydiae bacterium]|nr:hypothetical protein [Chlamydiota bacterium]